MSVHLIPGRIYVRVVVVADDACGAASARCPEGAKKPARCACSEPAPSETEIGVTMAVRIALFAGSGRGTSDSRGISVPLLVTHLDHSGSFVARKLFL